MARDLALRELTGRRSDHLLFALATEEDNEDLRRLFRQNPMRGRISLSLEREPNYFADANLPGEAKQTIIAREGNRLACAGSCTVRMRFVNGKVCRVGYLGGLRLAESLSGRFDILRRGYEFFHELQAENPADFYFTSIASDNERARRMFERGLRGMPRYEFLGEFITLLIPTSPDRRLGMRGRPDDSVRATPHDRDVEGLRQGCPPSLFPDELAALLNHKNSAYQFAPCWSVEELAALEPLGLGLSDFEVLSERGKIVACTALWDQRVFKQTVIKGYEPSLARSRSVLNFISRLTGGTRLPAVGEALAQAFISHTVVPPDASGTLIGLLSRLRARAAQRGIELLTVGFDANDPRLALLRRNARGREYRSCLYLVSWAETDAVPREPGKPLLAPEVALL